MNLLIIPSFAHVPYNHKKKIISDDPAEILKHIQEALDVSPTGEVLIINCDETSRFDYIPVKES